MDPCCTFSTATWRVRRSDGALLEWATWTGMAATMSRSPEAAGARGRSRCSRDGKLLHEVLGNWKEGPGDGDRHVGRCVGGIPDVDGDGVSDFVVVNVPYDSEQTGLVRVFSGRTGEPIFSVTRASLLRSASDI